MGSLSRVAGRSLWPAACLAALLFVAPSVRSQPQTTDTWARALGWDTDGGGIASDGLGNVYVVGDMIGARMVMGDVGMVGVGGSDAYVVKIDPEGTVLWGTVLGGKSIENGIGITVTGDGSSVYVTGYYMSTDFTAAGRTLPQYGKGDTFAAKLNGATGEVMWLTGIGAAGIEKPFGDPALDNVGHLYLLGSYNNQAGNGTMTLISHGGDDLFLVKMEAATGKVIYTKGFGTEGKDVPGEGLVVDSANGCLYFTWATAEAFINLQKVDLIKGATIWSKSFDGATATPGSVPIDPPNTFYPPGSAAPNWKPSLYVNPGAVALDPSGNVYLSGSMHSLTLSDKVKLAGKGHEDVFVAKFSPARGDVVWAMTFGGTDTEVPKGNLAYGASGLYVTGNMQPYTIVTAGEFSIASLGRVNAFLVRLDTATGKVLGATSTMGNAFDFGQGVAVNSVNSYLHWLGRFASVEVTLGPHKLEKPDKGRAAFVARLLPRQVVPSNWDEAVAALPSAGESEKSAVIVDPDELPRAPDSTTRTIGSQPGDQGGEGEDSMGSGSEEVESMLPSGAIAGIAAAGAIILLAVVGGCVVCLRGRRKPQGMPPQIANGANASV